MYYNSVDKHGRARLIIASMTLVMLCSKGRTVMKNDTNLTFGTAYQRKEAEKRCLRFSPQELQALVQAAQNSERQALNSLCAAFEPLVIKEAHVSYVQAALGEDALNTAWLIFLNFIQNYRRNNYCQLPGLIKKALHYDLLREAKEQTGDGSYSLDELKENGKELALQENLIENFTTAMVLQELLAKLPPKQKQAVQALVIDKMTKEEFCKRYGGSVKTAYKHRKQGLKKLKALLR